MRRVCCLPLHSLARPWADGKDADCQKQCCKKKCSDHNRTCPTGWTPSRHDDGHKASEAQKTGECCTKGCDSFSGSCASDQIKMTSQEHSNCKQLGHKSQIPDGTDHQAYGDTTATCSAKQCCRHTCGSTYASHCHLLGSHHTMHSR